MADEDRPDIPAPSVETDGKGNITFKNVRIAYPALVEPNVYQGDPTGYELTILLPKEDREVAKFLKDYLEAVAEENGNAFIPACSPVRDNDAEKKDQPHLVGTWSIKTRSRRTPPRVFKADMTELEGEDKAEVYSGCYAHVFCRGWSVVSAKAKKPWAGLALAAVQFAADGVRLGGGVSNEDLTAAFGAAPKKPTLASKAATPAKTGKGGPAPVPSGSNTMPEDFDDDIPF